MRSGFIRGDGDLSEAMANCLRYLAGETVPPKYRRRVRNIATIQALERRHLIEWENTEQRTGWKLTDKGRFVLEQLRTREATHA